MQLQSDLASSQLRAICICRRVSERFIYCGAVAYGSIWINYVRTFEFAGPGLD